MIDKELPIYICSPKVDLSNVIQSTKTVYNHTAGSINNRLVIKPNTIDKNNISPENFLNLKERLNIDKILFIDTVRGTEVDISIKDHVNISGLNFLRSKTPHKDYPQFPDMSNIYNPIKGYDQEVVYTLGIERFNLDKPESNNIYSELVGLITPIAHYVNLKVFALGLKQPNNILDII